VNSVVMHEGVIQMLDEEERYNTDDGESVYIDYCLIWKVQ